MNSFSDPLVHPRSGLRPNCDAASIHPITFCLNAPSRLGSLLRFVMSTSLGVSSRLLSSIPRRKTRLRCCRSLLQTCRCSSSVSTKDGNREAHITLGFAQSTNHSLPPRFLLSSPAPPKTTSRSKSMRRPTSIAVCCSSRPRSPTLPYVSRMPACPPGKRGAPPLPSQCRAPHCHSEHSLEDEQAVSGCFVCFL